MTARRLAARVLLGTLRLAVPLAIIVFAVLIARVLLEGTPPPTRAERATIATSVETVAVTRGPRREIVRAFGTVQPARTLMLRPQVGGTVDAMHEDLIEGGTIEAGALLLEIDERDYAVQLAQEEAALVRAEFELTLEQGRAVVAEREWALLDGEIESTELGERLARRLPHLEEKEAAVKAARSRVDRAALDLERTKLRVPFNALVLSESVEVGQLVNAQTEVATLIGTDVFHVRVSIPVDRLPAIQLPGPDGTGGSPVRILHASSDRTRPDPIGDGAPDAPALSAIDGRVVRLLGDVDPAGRMARLLVAVDDPLGLGAPTNGRPAISGGPDAPAAAPLLIGEYVEVAILGRERDLVCAIPRRAVREGDRIYVMNAGGALEIREVDVAWGNDAEVIVASGIQDGDRIVISPIAAPVSGMPLREVGAAAASDGMGDATGEATSSGASDGRSAGPGNGSAS